MLRSNPFARPMLRGEFTIWMLLIASTILLGTVGFVEHDHQGIAQASVKNWLDSVYKAIRLLILANDEIENPPFLLRVARWLGVLSAFGALRWFSGKVSGKEVRPSLSNHVIICGLGVMGRRFAEQFHKGGARVVVIEDDPSNPRISLCRDLGITVIQGDAADPQILSQARIAEAHQIICLCPDKTNRKIQKAVAALVNRGARRTTAGALRCFLHINAQRKMSRLMLRSYKRNSAKLNTWKPAPTRPVEYEFFNIEEMSARLMMNDDGCSFLAEGDQADGHLHLVLIGWDKPNQALLREAVRRWRRHAPWLDQGKQLKVTIVCQSAQNDFEQALEEIRQRHPVVEQSCEIEIISVKDPGWQHVLLPKLDKNTRVYIGMNRDTETVLAVDSLGKHVHGPGWPCPVLVTIKQSWTTDNPVHLAVDQSRVFYLQDRACRPDNLLSICERIARAIHEEYLRTQRNKGVKMGAKPAMTPWSRLNNVFKQSNLLQAANLIDCLNASQTHQYHLSPLEDWDMTAFQFDAAAGNRDLEAIAEKEHERFLLEDARRNSRAKAHQPWDGLDSQDQDIARDQVRAWPRILLYVGFWVVRQAR